MSVLIGKCNVWGVRKGLCARCEPLSNLGKKYLIRMAQEMVIREREKKEKKVKLLPSYAF